MPGYISEILYAGNSSADFIEIAVPAGTDVSGYTIQIYDDEGELDETVSLGSIVQTVGGVDVYVVDGYSLGGEDSAAVALVDDQGDAVQFVSFGETIEAEEGGASGETSVDIGTSSSSQSLQSDDGGETYHVQTSPNPGTIPCYAPGTLIDTPDGPRAVEMLKVGDLVDTLDHGPQPIRWTRSGEHPLEDAGADAKPVLIKAGALGRLVPTQDLIVSPQHRIFVGGGQLPQIFSGEAFAPAKSLTMVPGIRHMKGKQKITWIHFACDRHEVVLANGCLSESLLLGPMVLNGLTGMERQSLTKIFGSASTPNAALNGPPARECLTVGAVRRQLDGRLKEKQQLLANEIRKWDVDLAMEQYEAEQVRDARSK